MPPYPRPPVDEILSAMPELAPYAREAVWLDAEQGDPAVRDSSLGGPLLWPREDPWPTCSLPDEEEGSGLPPNAMVPVAQIFARDVPGSWWPEGLDLLQILWCPVNHWEVPRNQSQVSPFIELRWRRAADVRDILLDPPQPVRQDDQYCYQLTPCTVTPELLVDFPDSRELPEELRPRMSQLIEQTSDAEGLDFISCVGGWKIGGWPTWRLNYPRTLTCGVCGSSMVLLFTIASDDIVGATVGRWGDLRLFVCFEHHQEFVADLH